MNALILIQNAMFVVMVLSYIIRLYDACRCVCVRVCVDIVLLFVSSVMVVRKINRVSVAALICTY